MIRPLACLALLACCLAAAEPVLDDCRKAGNWTFSPGAEFPGATGGIAPVDGQGLGLSWDFSAGGAYVAATWRGKPPADLTGFAFTVVADQACTAAVRLRDASGRTFQSEYLAIPKGPSTLPRACAGPWSGAWGGPDKTTVPATPISIAILIDKRNGTPAKGSLLLTGLAATGAQP